MKSTKDKNINRIYRNPVSISLLNKGMASKIFEEVNIEGAKVVLKNNKPIGVIVSPAAYDEMLEKLEDYDLLIEAGNRISAGNKKSFSQNETMEMFGVTQDELDQTNIEVDHEL